MEQNNKLNTDTQSCQTAVSGSVTASELRIGNILTHNEFGVFEIDGINPHCGDFKIESKSRWVYLKNCEPINITEEWLLKHGFQKQEYSNLSLYYLRLIVLSHGTITFYPKENGFNIDLGTVNGYNFGTTKIKYLHQIQNLYFAITGSELQVVL